MYGPNFVSLVAQRSSPSQETKRVRRDPLRLAEVLTEIKERPGATFMDLLRGLGRRQALARSLRVLAAENAIVRVQVNRSAKPREVHYFERESHSALIKANLFAGQLLVARMHSAAKILQFVGERTRVENTEFEEVASAVQYNLRTVRNSVGRLVEAGLLIRKASTADGKYAYYHLSEAAKQGLRNWQATEERPYADRADWKQSS